jgi:hypothetical protein
MFVNGTFGNAEDFANFKGRLSHCGPLENLL